VTNYVVKASQNSAIDPYELAMLPMVRLSPNAEPSETYGSSDSDKLDSAYFDVVNTGLWSYQIYTYLELLEKLFDERVKIEVSDWLLDMLNANQHAGDRLETVFAVIEHAIRASQATMDSEYEGTRVSVEMSIALAMLVELPESPDFAAGNGARHTRIRLINADVDQTFASSLKHAANDVFSVLLPVLEALGAVIPDAIRALSTPGSRINRA